MTERGLPSMDGAPACPFVAFGDDRDSRAPSPDHRHRCFAESPPAPRALAHQEAYCLSSAFPVCPTFQDWARREAAQARADAARSGDDAAAGAGAIAGAAVVGAGSAWNDDPADDVRPDPPPADPLEDPPVRRNPPRDWAAPPPWATGAASTSRAAGTSPDGSELLASKSVEGRGLAGSAADQLAGGPPPATPSAAWTASAAGAASTAADGELADLVQARPQAAPQPSSAGAYPPSSVTGARPAVSSTRPTGPEISGPSWERMRRYEAYPTIKSRPGMPGLPRVAVLAGALGIAALALFMLPALLGIGGGGSNASPSPSVPVATAIPSPTPVPAPTPQVYVIKQGDTLSKIARRFGLTIDVLLAANTETIKDPNKIAIGDQIIIPLPPTIEEASPDTTEPSPT